KTVHHVTVGPPLLAKSFSERQRNLANVRHLLHGETNDRDKTFPLRLPNDSQPAAKIAGSVHHGILRKRIANLRQRVIQREIARHNSRENTRLACWGWRLAIADF